MWYSNTRKNKGGLLKMRINFDMDGTLCDFYGVSGWLSYLKAEDTTPYEIAKPRLNLSALAQRLNIMKRNGYEIAVISWRSKNASAEFNAAVEAVKREWLAKHLPSVAFDAVVVVPYGTPKTLYCYDPADVLFDDEAPNREGWAGRSYDAEDILNTLKAL
jgi:hypothetical protein